MRCHTLTNDAQEQLILYALDRLSPEQAYGVADHLHLGCVLCGAEFQRITGVLGLLGYSAPASAPPPKLRTQLMAQVSKEPKSWRKASWSFPGEVYG